MRASEFEVVFVFIAAFLAGCFAILPALVLETVVALFQPDVLQSVFLNALTEELLKLLAFFAILFVCNDLSKEETVFTAALIGFGFGFSENILFSVLVPASSALEFISFRIVAPLPMHVISTALVGFGFSQSKKNPLNLILFFALAVALHFAFNSFFLFF